MANRKAGHDVRPGKKRRCTNAIVAAPNTAGRQDLKRKEPPAEVIEVLSDSETEVLSAKRKKVDVDTVLTKEEEVDDDDYIDLLASLDVSNDANWVLPPASNKAEDKPGVDPYKPHILPPLPVPKPKPHVDHSELPLDWYSLGQWGMIARGGGITKFPKPSHHARRQDNPFPYGYKRSPKLYYDRGYNKLELTAKYPHLTSGSVNKIIQAPGKAVLGAVVSAGFPDYSDDEDDQPPPPPENRAGSLVVYNRGRVHVAQAHCHTRMTSRGSTLKYYSVEDVAFNPFNSSQFLSSGHDFVVRLWEIPDDYTDDDGEGLHMIRDIIFDDIPQDLIYEPDGSAIAITCRDATVSLFDSQELFESMTKTKSAKFSVAPNGMGHAAGTTIWGDGPSKHFLFTSSEPLRDDVGDSGFHRAFDVLKGVRAIEFDATEAGDAAAVSPDGTTLVLITSGEGNSHPVRLYDVRRRQGRAYETEGLEKFFPRGSSQGPEEVTRASFLSDGRLLALARNDNMVHIYDVRAWSRGPLCRFEHHDSDAVGGGGYGVVEIKWIEARGRVGIVSGGNDGCVRLWEPALASADEAQGAVIGRTDFDVGHFSIGDQWKGEKPLIIGDSGGAMHVYDFTNDDGVPI
ncbi:WD40 repeat-like protein [Paxillus ammoniavirescens]|nr:WD40 repeat-like protein [Paxillus ammoniavirescens]